MRPYSPGGALNALATAQAGLIPPTPSAHRLGRGLPGYLILFAPHAFAPQRQVRARKPPSPPVFLSISTDFTPTPRVPLPSPALQRGSFERHSSVKPRDFTLDLPSRLRALTPSNSEQHSPPPYYRGCWHGVSRGFLWWYRQISQLFAERRSSHLTGVYDPKAFIPHAASLGQGFPHCPRFPTAASRRSRDRISIPVWLVVLSDQLPVVALVGHYPTN